MGPDNFGAHFSMSSSAPKAPAIHSSAQFLPDNPRQQSPPTLPGSSQPSIYVFFSLPILLPSAWTTASIFNEPVTPFDLTAPSLHPLFFQPHFPPGACTQTCSLVVLPPPRRSTGGAGKQLLTCCLLSCLFLSRSAFLPRTAPWVYSFICGS